MLKPFPPSSRSLLVLVAAAVAACGDGTTTAPPVESTVEAGRWMFSRELPLDEIDEETIIFGPETLEIPLKESVDVSRDVSSTGFTGPFALHASPSDKIDVTVLLDGTVVADKKTLGDDPITVPIDLTPSSQLVIRRDDRSRSTGGDDDGHIERLILMITGTPKTSETIDPANIPPGEEVEVVFQGGDVMVAISADALPGGEPIELTVEEVTTPSNEAITAFEFGPAGTVFEEPITVTLGYDPTDLPPGVAEDQLGLHFQVGDPADDRWFFQANSVADPATNTVSAPVFHFSTGGVAPVRLEPARSVAVAAKVGCAVNPSGQAFCWGADNLGVLGTNQTTDTCTELDTPVGNSAVVTLSCTLRPFPVEGNIVFSELSGAGSSMCGITTAGDVYCWGASLDGDRTPVEVPTLVPGGVSFGDIDVSWAHACGMTTAGDAACWGRNNAGQLGDGSTTNSATPVLVSGPALAAVDAGFFHSCGITALNEPYCWGNAGIGAFGDGGASPTSPTPVPAATGLSLTQLQAGTFLSCGLESDGTGHCWGFFNQFIGQHGTGTLANSNVPVPIAGGLTFSQLSVHSQNAVMSVNCGITTSGEGYCWGLDSNGQLGTGGAAGVCPTFLGDLACETAPVAVTGGLAFDEIDVEPSSVCGRTTAGRVYCWGWNGWGQLGTGTQTDSNVPIRVANPVGG